MAPGQAVEMLELKGPVELLGKLGLGAAKLPPWLGAPCRNALWVCSVGTSVDRSAAWPAEQFGANLLLMASAGQRPPPPSSVDL